MRRERPPWNGVAPRPWELLRATAETPWGPLDVVDVHVSIGTRNPWDKVKTCDALAASLESAPRMPRIVAGDFGAPKREHAGGVTGFGLGSPKRGALWEEAELALVGPAARHGLADAFRQLHPVAEAPLEHSVFSDGAPRRFDHVLASPHLVPEQAEYRRDWSEERGLSEHAALLVAFRVERFWALASNGEETSPPPAGPA
jgi:endonuclease/exonuclease/phosphatase family metal-dependent hydrolase